MKKAGLLILGIIAFSFLFAQKTIRFNKLSIRDGLSQSSILSLIQDEKGFIWAGTQDGLNRYDGYSFKVYKHQIDNKNSLSNSFINSVQQDSKTLQFWIGTQNGGLNRYDPVKERFHSFPKENILAQIDVQELKIDANGSVWFTTQNSGLFHYWSSSDKLERYNTSNGFPTNKLSRILIVENKIILGTRGRGVVVFDKKTRKAKLLNETQNLLDNTILSIVKYADKKVLIGTNEGINLLDLEKMTIQLPDFIQDKNVNFASAILVLDSTIWVGTNGNGLICFQKKGEQYIRDEFVQNDFNSHSLSSNIINSILKDRFGTIWIGTQDGLSYFDPVKQFFEHYNHLYGDKNSLLDKNVWSIYEDGKTLWVGTRDGVTSIETSEDKYTRYPYNGKTVNNSVYAITKDKYNRFWVGTVDGLFHFVPEQKRFIPIEFRETNENQHENRVNHLHIDQSDNLWVACNEGISKLNLSSLEYKFYSNLDTGRYQLPNYECKTITVDKNKILWIGLNGGGICKGVPDAYDSTRYQFVNYTNEGEDTLSISNNTVLSILEGYNHSIWIGTYGGGLNKMDITQDLFEVYTEENGLSNNAIYGLLREDSARIWVSTNFGLSRFNTVDTLFKNFTEDDGLQSNEFNNGAYHKGKSGKMYFGGINGLNAFYPSKIQQNKIPPNVVITDVLLFNESIIKKIDTLPSPIYLKTLKLPYKENNVTFKFAALHYTHPEGNKYRIMLEGLYEIPLDLGDMEQINYSNLSPGTYLFKVWAANSDGVWTENPTEVRLIITPPFWKTWWFVTAASFFVLLIFYISYVIRISAMKSQKRKLTFLVEKRTKTITKQKQEIEKQKELLEIEKNKAEELLLNILPAETAEELKNKGQARTRYYRLVTVMFTDIVGFTKIAERMSPIDLVTRLDKLFKVFDEIIDKHQIEKIKTIGDAYMAAGGVPLRDKENPVNSVLAALEIQAYMKQQEKELKAKGEEYWELRVGLHTGDVIAGVIGKKRIAYDIWGNTVNVAQRMETAGEPGKVNVSGTTYEHIKPYFNCTYRGKIAAKNKGEIDMYFVDRIKPHLSKDADGTIPNQKFKDYVNLHIYSSINYRKAERHIMRILEEKLSPKLHYHGIHHTYDVVDAVERIAIMEGVLDEDIFVLKSAATYHDAGFVEQYDNNEPIGARMASEILPKYGYTPEQVKIVEELIYATRIPHKPNNLLEEIICDADLDYLGRDDFFEISDTLRRELRDHGKINSDRLWDEIQVKFLTQHKYFTKSAIKLRQEKKMKHLEIIKQRLKEDNYVD